MTASEFTPVTPEAAAAALDAALFDGAPADERLLDAWATIAAMGERIAAAERARSVRKCNGYLGGGVDCIAEAEHEGPCWDQHANRVALGVTS